jgi:cell division protein FtsB
MIQVNLLPPEHRGASGTPVGRFVAIIVGVVLFIGASCAYAYTHFIQLAKVEEVRDLRREEAATKETQRDRSIALQKEIDEYQQRRRAIQTINRNRILWSKKLDQFFDVATGRAGDAAYNVWLEELEVPTQLATSRRASGAPAPGASANTGDGGALKFSGFMAMESKNEAPAQSSAFHKAVTGEADGRPSEFYEDFLSISNPTIDILEHQVTGENLTPPVVAAFKYEMRLKPPALDAPK